MRLAIVGSRNFTDYARMCYKINHTLQKWGKTIADIELIISGGADGTDTMAELFAAQYNIKTRIFLVDWKKFGKNAGPRRNTYIVNACSHMIAFPSIKGKGTQDSIKKAQKASRTVEIAFVDAEHHNNQDVQL